MPKPTPPPRPGRGSITIEIRPPKVGPFPEPIISGDPAPDVIIRVPAGPPMVSKVQK